MVQAYRPLSLREALAIRSNRKTIVFAGGSDLMVRHRSWSGVAPRFELPVLMIGHLPELQAIRLADHTLTIGAGCTLAQILGHPGVPEYVKRPLARMASPAIRNIATLGGNIGHASPAGDSLPMLYALGAQLTLQSGEGQSVVNLADFITGPGRTILKEHEIIRHIHIPLDAYNRLYYRKVGTRRANSIAKLSVFAVARAVETRLDEIRISFGAVAPTVVRSQKAEALLKTLWPGEVSARLEAVQACYAPLITPIDDRRSSKAYRRRVAFCLLQECLCDFSEEPC